MRNILFFLREKKLIVFCIVLWALISCSIFLSYRSEWSIAMSQPRIIQQEGEIDELSKDERIELDSDDCLVQKIESVSSEITGISLYLDARNVGTDSKLLISVSKENGEEIIQAWQFEFNIRREEGFYDFMFDKGIAIEEGEELQVSLETENLNGSRLYVYLTKSDNSGTSLVLNNSEINGEIVPYKVFEGTYFTLKYLLIFLYVIMTVTLFGCCFLLIKKKRMESIFCCMLIAIGMLYMFILPPFVVPDEPSHFVTAYSQSSKLLGEQVYDENGKILVSSDKLWGDSLRQRKVSKEAYYQFFEGVLGKLENKMEMVSTRPPLTTKHPGYIPQILGISMARAINMNSEQILFMGRLFALAWYGFVMYWAIKLMPIKKTMLFIVGLLPMTMQQVVSFNYDSVLLGLCFFTISYILNLIYTDRKLKVYDWIIILLLAFSIASIKFVYLPIFGLAIFIPKDKFKTRKRKVIAAIGLIFFSMFVVICTRLLDYHEAMSLQTQTAEGATKISFDYCINNMFTVVGIFYRTLERQLPRFVSEMLASPLGWLDISLPVTIVMALALLLLISIIQKEGEMKAIKVSMRMYMIIRVLLITFLTMVVLFLDWTPLGATQIEGLQGRYFLPFLPLALLVFQNKNLFIRKSIDNYLILCLGYIHCLVVFFVSLIAIGQ